jgi:hypothetical protein
MAMRACAAKQGPDATLRYPWDGVAIAVHLHRDLKGFIVAWSAVHPLPPFLCTPSRPSSALWHRTAPSATTVPHLCHHRHLGLGLPPSSIAFCLPQLHFFAGSYSDYEEDRRRRLGTGAGPTRLKFRKLATV